MSSSRFAKVSYLRNFIFGVEDSLVSTVGLLSGIAIAGMTRTEIMVTGVVLILVEAFSMAAGSFLSETSAEEYEGRVSNGIPLIDGFIMFISYVIAGLVPLLPYVYMSFETAFKVSISLSLLSLFILGLIGSMYTNIKKRHPIRRGIRMLVIGGVAIAVGIIAGQFAGM